MSIGGGHAPKNQTHAVFVDGENFSIRLGKVENLTEGRYLRHGSVGATDQDIYWHIAYSEYFAHRMQSSRLFRIYYYGSVKGDDERIEVVRTSLQGMNIGDTFIIRKKAGKSKAVDVKLTTDLLSLAASGRVDEIILVGVDADYVPVVQKAKDLGVVMTLAFPGFDLLRTDHIAEPEKVNREMGASKSKEYLLAFDRIYRDFPWFDFKSFTSDELGEIASDLSTIYRVEYNQQWIPALKKTTGDWILHPNGGTTSPWILTSAGTISRKFKNETYETSLMPVSTLKERFIGLANPIHRR